MWRSISRLKTQSRARLLKGLISLLLCSSVAFSVSAKTAHPTKVLKHEILPGDTLDYVARLYGTTVKSIQSLNRGLRPTRMSVGVKVKVKPGWPMRAFKTFRYEVRPGDTLGKIARKYKASAQDIKRWNLLKSTRIRIGQELRIRTMKAMRSGLAMGVHTRGRLVNGEQMPPGPGYHIRNPVETFAASTTIDHLLGCFRNLHRSDRRMPNFVVGDISLRKGGRFPPHVSHQNGLDVDLGYVPNRKSRGKYLRRFFYANRRNMDASRTMDMIQCFDRTGDLTHVFVDYHLQRVLYKEARKTMSKAELKRVFQYPRGKGSRVGLIRHSKGHVNHMHLRFRNENKHIASVR